LSESEGKILAQRGGFDGVNKEWNVEEGRE
jgi:hypothetical protein